MEETKNQTIKYSYADVNSKMDSMRGMFDIVRLVDAQECREIAMQCGMQTTDAHTVRAFSPAAHIRRKPAQNIMEESHSKFSQYR